MVDRLVIPVSEILRLLKAVEFVAILAIVANINKYLREVYLFTIAASPHVASIGKNFKTSKNRVLLTEMSVSIGQLRQSRQSRQSKI